MIYDDNEDLVRFWREFLGERGVKLEEFDTRGLRKRYELVLINAGIPDAGAVLAHCRSVLGGQKLRIVLYFTGELTGISEKSLGVEIINLRSITSGDLEARIFGKNFDEKR